ncbi:hypothetical protein ACIQNI_20045 [Streptomyces sp. NPDC091266]|uniref:hypothetical protein n=1 Tax=Streptomyces sp. NPDC091266 TaxID=3365978 RepID=UPI003821D10E
MTRLSVWVLVVRRLLLIRRRRLLLIGVLRRLLVVLLLLMVRLVPLRAWVSVRLSVRGLSVRLLPVRLWWRGLLRGGVVVHGYGSFHDAAGQRVASGEKS